MRNNVNVQRRKKECHLQDCRMFGILFHLQFITTGPSQEDVKDKLSFERGKRF